MNDIKNELSELEADLYDRQIRLWGIESQKKLREADILLVGVRALGAEITKNILLSGIKSLTFLDDGVVTASDIMTNFLLPRNSVGQNIAVAVVERAKALNPIVIIHSDVSNIKSKDATFYEKFTLIIVTQQPPEQLISINQICRQNDTQFICGDVFGLFGYTFSDLQIHEFYEDVTQLVTKNKRKSPGAKIAPAEAVKVKTIKSINFIPLQDALGKDWMEDTKKVSKLSRCYFITRVLLMFRDLYHRNPSIKERQTDTRKLKDIWEKLSIELNVDNSIIPDSVFSEVFEEVVPVCAIVGGVLAQEVIRAVSHNEPPINNMFFFDPENMSGKIECVGYESYENQEENIT